jgi:hypothetical protein
MRTLIFLAALLLLLPACTSLQGLSGQFATNAGLIKVHPDGRFEIVVDPRNGK